MSMQDPIADMLTRIRNAQAVGELTITLPASQLKVAMLRVMQEEGYIESFEGLEDGPKRNLKVSLKYYLGRPVIDKIKRVSKPGIRIYKKHHELPRVLSGMGIAIISTPKGVMSERAARAQKLGGEVLCTIE
jgi:small subunit ribosomal protein S8